MFWQTGRYKLNLSRPHIMGIVNVTPDSFSDGGQYYDKAEALRHAEYLLRCGADILDIGGESTRPNAIAVSAQEEIQRILPVVREALRFNVPISVDTYKPQVMQAVLDAGADIINDVYALRWHDEKSPEYIGEQIISQHPNCGVCLMHMHRNPQNMQRKPMLGSGKQVVQEVQDFLQQRSDYLCGLGIKSSRIALDTGIGFGKTPEQNLTLLHQHAHISALGYATVAGWSRKSTLGSVLDAMPSEVVEIPYKSELLPHSRSLLSAVAAVLAVEKGANIVRVHDVAATKQALSVWQAMQEGIEQLDIQNKLFEH